MDCPGPGRDDRLSTFRISSSVPVTGWIGTGNCLVAWGYELDGEGTGDASRAIEICLDEASAEGEPGRNALVESGVD